MRIRILEVSKSTGGVGQYMRWLGYGLDKDYFELTFACLSDEGPALAAELSGLPGVQAYSLAMDRYKINPLTDGWVGVQLARAIRQGQFDLIHAHASKAGFLARLAAAGTGIPVIYSPHYFAFQDGAGRVKATLYAGVERFTARYLTARIMTVSNHEREAARRHHVGCDEQFVTVYSGIDLRIFDTPIDPVAQRAALGLPATGPLIGAVGRLYPPKMPIDLVRAAAKVHAQHPEVHFLWIGTGPLEAQTRTEIEGLGLSDVFHLLGHRQDVPQILMMLSCFVLPSRWEALPLVLLEAMAARVPVVATRNVGTAEVIQEGVSGLLVPPDDPEQLARALLDLLADPAKAQVLSANGRERVEQEFTRDRMLKKVAQVYQETYEIYKRTS